MELRQKFKEGVYFTVCEVIPGEEKALVPLYSHFEEIQIPEGKIVILKPTSFENRFFLRIKEAEKRNGYLRDLYFYFRVNDDRIEKLCEVYGYNFMAADDVIYVQGYGELKIDGK